LDTKKVEGSLIFLTGIYFPSSNQQFRFYDLFRDDRLPKNCNSGQTAMMRETLNLGLFGWDSTPELNTKRLENSPSFLSVIYRDSSDQWFRRYGILRIGKTAEN
jgi:hypothetical protein